MNLLLRHTRKKDWKEGNLYLLPTIRFSWRESARFEALEAGGRDFTEYVANLSLLWLFIKIDIYWNYESA